MGQNDEPRRDDVLTAASDDGRDDDAGGAPWLRVLADSFVTWHRLPKSGNLVLGRADDADIRIDHPSISRKHAVLRVAEAMTIEDLGSSNGTRAGKRTLRSGESAVVSVGDAIELGSVVAILHPAGTPERPRRLRAHAAFEAALARACRGATLASEAFTVARLHVVGSVTAGAVEELLLGGLTPPAVGALYGPGEYEVLLRGNGTAAASALAPLAQALEEKGAVVRTGLATYPIDGRSPEELVAAACARVRGDRPPESGAVVVDGGAMQELLPIVERVAVGTISVLLLGETGVGKEILAETLHALSPRAPKKLLRINCAALSESLLESELFGHEKGAFTGATSAKTGLFENANGGSVFLDEVAELPLAVQVKLLRVLEDRQVLRIGSLTPRSIDVRFIAATNRDLEAEAAAGRFRQDLLFRLNGVMLTIPPLRERVKEIEALARTFVARSAGLLKRRTPAISIEALDALRRYAWPGNIRELKNAMDRAVLLCDGDSITPEHLPKEKMRAASSNTMPPPGAGDPASDGNAERDRILQALAHCAGNQSQAAKFLGISRGTLVARLEQYGLPRPRKGR